MNRKEWGAVRRLTNKLLTNQHYEFSSSSNPNKVYRTVVMVDGKVMCNCRGWTIKKLGQPRQCKHTREVIGNRETRTDSDFIYLV